VATKTIICNFIREQAQIIQTLTEDRVIDAAEWFCHGRASRAAAVLPLYAGYAPYNAVLGHAKRKILLQTSGIVDSRGYYE
jgi:hypothetical protein